MTSYKFIQKLWTLHNKILNHINKNYEENSGENLEKITHSFIKKITNNFNNFNYNIAIANVHELYNSLNKELNNKYKQEIIISNYKKILICLIPIIPHFSSEAISDIKVKDKFEWPNYDESLLVEETIQYVIQINGKKELY